MEWNWSATPLHVTARTSFPPYNPWMFMAPQMHDCQSWTCSSSTPSVFPVNSGSYPSFGYHPWTGPVLQTHNLVGTKNPSESSHPFFIRFITGNIRIVQGCKNSVRLSDGSIPSPPLDIIDIVVLDIFDKKSGEWCYSYKDSHCHYHRLSCIVKVELLFIPSSLQIPQELQQNLLTVTENFLLMSLA